MSSVSLLPALEGPRPRAGRRVLVVDDNRDAAESLAELLRLYGYTVQIAFDPHGALELAGGFAPEVAILDIGLPGMDGYELAQRLHLHLGASGCTLIALSGYDAAEDLQRSRAAGFAAHLVKPVEFDTLHAAIRAASARG